jgi:hypothetical protein
MFADFFSDFDRRRNGSRHDDFAGFERHTESPDGVGEPCHSIGWVPQHRSASTCLYDFSISELRGFEVETSEDLGYPIHHLYAVVVIRAEGSRSNSQLRFPSHNVRYRLSLRNSCIGCQ